jgi:hypothetical protein
MMNAFFRRFCLWQFLALGLLAGRAGAAPPDLALVPLDAQGFATFRMADYWNLDVIQGALKESKEAASLPTLLKDMLGLGPADVERATFVVQDGEKQQMWILIHTAKPYDKKVLLEKFEKLTNKKPEERTHKTKSYYAFGEDVLHFGSDRLFVFAPEKAIKNVLDMTPRARTEGPLAGALQLAEAGKHQIVAGIGVVPEKYAKQLRDNPPAGFGPYLVFLEQKGVVLTVHTDKDQRMELATTFPTAAKAKEAKEALDGIKVLAETFLDTFKNMEDLPPEAKKAFEEAQKALKTMQSAQKGTEVRVRMKADVDRAAMGKAFKQLAELINKSSF